MKEGWVSAVYSFTSHRHLLPRPYWDAWCMCAARRVLRDECCDRNGMFGLDKQSKVSFHRHAHISYLPLSHQSWSFKLISDEHDYNVRTLCVEYGRGHQSRSSFTQWMIQFPSTTRFKLKTKNPYGLKRCVSIRKVARSCSGGKGLFTALDDDGKSIGWTRGGDGGNGRRVILSMKTAHRQGSMCWQWYTGRFSPIPCIHWHSRLCSSTLPARLSFA